MSFNIGTISRSQFSPVVVVRVGVIFIVAHHKIRFANDPFTVWLPPPWGSLCILSWLNEPTNQFGPRASLADELWRRQRRRRDEEEVNPSSIVVRDESTGFRFSRRVPPEEERLGPNCTRPPPRSSTLQNVVAIAHHRNSQDPEPLNLPVQPQVN